MRDEKKITLIFLAVAIVALGFAIWYAVFQYNLCYPEVSDSVWYCLRHAGF